MNALLIETGIDEKGVVFGRLQTKHVDWQIPVIFIDMIFDYFNNALYFLSKDYSSLSIDIWKFVFTKEKKKPIS